MSGGGTVRSVEVRPSWSAAEWAQVSGAASAAGYPLGTWAGEVLTAVLQQGHGPTRYTQRGDQWRRLLERWQSVFWACVALKPQVPAGWWDPVAETVALGGAVLVEQIDQITELERRRAREVIAAVTGMVETLGPRTRRRAAAKSDGHPRDGRHRAKMLLTPTAHDALSRASQAGGWEPSDYAGAAVATAATLMLTDTYAAAEVALLAETHALVQSTAARLADLVTGGQAPTVEVWDAAAVDLAAAVALLRQAQTARGPAEAILDVRASIPGVFLTLGWAAQWAVSGR